jgi:hypothetical protein
MIRSMASLPDQLTDNRNAGRQALFPDEDPELQPRITAVLQLGGPPYPINTGFPKTAWDHFRPKSSNGVTAGVSQRGFQPALSRR